MPKEPNYSIVGTESQGMTMLQKSGIAVFIFGLLSLYFVFQEKGTSLYFSALLAFSTQLLGAALFTYHSDNFASIRPTNWFQKGALLGHVFVALGLAILAIAWMGFSPIAGPYSLFICFSLLALGIFWQIKRKYVGHTAGIKNNDLWTSSLTARGVLGWISGIILTVFYIQLYWGTDPFPELIAMFDSLSMVLKGKSADKWFVYGTLYTFVILFLGIKFLYKYRHNRYQLIRTVVVIFSQLVLAYFIPNIMEALSYDTATAVIDGKETYLGYYSANPINSWPLNYGAFEPGTLKAYTQEAYQPIGIAYLFWGFILFLVVTPVVTYYVGKRWYCSWFCGCGGLAETAGDSFRHLSNKSIKAWKIERWLIHSVMVFVLLMTLAVLIPFFSGKEFSFIYFTLNKGQFVMIAGSLLLLGGGTLYYFYRKTQFKHTALLIGLILFLVLFVLLIVGYFTGNNEAFLLKSSSLKKTYGFFVGSTFSGIIGVGFYPILGNRVWCRFGCPMAGYMGLIQRFKSRFRITTNGGQCISCGNCSTYCEQGIDVRAYAQKGQNIVRASCVGCGICSAVCPRGVLKLENGPEEGRIQENPILIGKDGITLNL